jgi:hypothetical protein
MDGYTKRQAWLKTFRWLFINTGDLAYFVPIIFLFGFIISEWMPGWGVFFAAHIAAIAWLAGFHALAVLVDLWIDD